MPIKTPLSPPAFSEWIVAKPLSLELIWQDGALASIRLDYDQGRSQTRTLTPKGREMAEALRRYVTGQEPDWPDLDLDFAALPNFTARVLRTLHQQVGLGRTVSYGQLARMAGSPGAAQAVGQALRRNPWPLMVPCHRVLGAGGGLTGFTNPNGLALKRDLLILEHALPAS